MTVVGSDMPPEIWEIVQKAGPSNVFYWSNRWRVGKKPGVGQAGSEMTNSIPGSPITATQGTTSEMPISDNRGYKYIDDMLVSQQFDWPADSPWTLAYVGTVPDGRAFRVRSTQNSSRVWIYYSSRPRPLLRDASGNQSVGAFTHSDGTEPAAYVVQYRPSDGITYASVSAQASGSNRISLTGFTFSGADLRMGYTGGPSGVGREYLAAPATYTDSPLDLADRIWRRHQ